MELGSHYTTRLLFVSCTNNYALIQSEDLDVRIHLSPPPPCPRQIATDSSMSVILVLFYVMLFYVIWSKCFMLYFVFAYSVATIYVSLSGLISSIVGERVIFFCYRLLVILYILFQNHVIN